MNIENIHDALNLLDDDMIEAVEQLRNEKPQSINKYKKNTWIRWVAMAACLCLVVGSYYLTDGFGLISYKGENHDSIKEESGDWTPNHGASESLGSVPESDNDEDGTDVTDDMSGEEVDLQKVMVQIVSWGEQSFTGTVVGDTDAFEDGMTVSVQFEETFYVELSNEHGTEHFSGEKIAEVMPVESIVLVEFSKQETVLHSTKDEDNTMTKVELIIYAETITLSDAE